MAIINFVAYVAEFAGIALGAGIVGIPAPLAIIGALAIHASMVLTGSYTWFERFALALSLAKVVSSLTVIGLLLAGFTPRKQALHDLLAGCLVIMD